MHIIENKTLLSLAVTLFNKGLLKVIISPMFIFSLVVGAYINGIHSYLSLVYYNNLLYNNI